MSDNKKLFLSAVSHEFLAYRELLKNDLKRPTIDIAEQEEFIVTGGSTLEKLDDYIRACDGIIHIIGKAAGAMPEEPAVARLLKKYPDFATRLPPLAPSLSKPQPGFSYTQWEAYLALYHDRPLFVYLPTDFELDYLNVPRDARFVFNPDEVQAQRKHYKRISDLGHDRGQFLNEERLSSAVLRDLVEILPRLETNIDVPPTKLRHTAERLIGRDEDLARLDAAWNGGKNVVIVRAFGGMGKTSLVATWMAELASKNWRGAEDVFDWTFYSQGTSDQRVASADSLIAGALTAFGDPDPTKGSPWDRGARLAGLVGKTRCLLVLDGLEPLQYAPGTMGGRLKDPGIEALLKGLCAHNAGLCVVTTRERVSDIQQHYGRTADDIELFALTDLAGAALLHHHGATRAGAHEIKPDDKELQSASREVRGILSCGNTSASVCGQRSPRRGGGRIGDFTSTSARRQRTSPSPPSKISNRSIKPWPTPARRGCSRRRLKRSTMPASSEGMKPTARTNLAPLVPTWEPSPASSRPRGAVYRPHSRTPTKPGC